MAFLLWKEQYSVGIKLFDDQHKQLFELINGLVGSLKKEKGDQGFEKAVNGLIDYTNEHFHTEEMYMRRYNYPGVEEHVRAHDVLTARVAEFRKNLLDQKADPDGLMRFLMDWLVNHIMGTDKKYTAFFNSLPEKIL
jgi:hemerythrin-like metal-binding protein